LDTSECIQRFGVKTLGKGDLRNTGRKREGSIIMDLKAWYGVKWINMAQECGRFF